MTVLEAVVRVLREAKRPMSAREIHAQIQAQKLYNFIAIDEVGIVRNAIRRHLRACRDGDAITLVEEADRDKYRLPRDASSS